MVDVVEAWFVGAVIGYLLGSIPTGLWIGKWRGGGDIRTSGSGRTGATNTFRALGLRWSVTVLALDALKGALPILIMMVVWDSPTGEVVGGLAAVVGHQFPLFAGFRGGRGAATALGGMIAIMPMGALFALGSAIPILLRIKVMSLATLTGATSAAVGISLLAAFGAAPDAYIGFAIGTWVLVFWGHRDNLERLAAGTERVLSMGGRSA
ncbi:MAG: glycerol-3-phosphate 1-O-acyltransferase PlsY [Chloroflexota bacterium]|nr:glycerol-3-phosphate 1-O-acyltransferase PlsY [Chloroflexota bacterium]MDE2892054.1 glycerol-3-phosphate 1-O-acyltransferase PlsY [Chloroflexota bacterium]